MRAWKAVVLINLALLVGVGWGYAFWGLRAARFQRELAEAQATAATGVERASLTGHVHGVKSVPAQRATLAEPPTRVELWFNERLEPAYSRVSVTNEAGTQVDLRDVAVSSDDPRRLAVSLPALVPGRYTVSFRVLSVDGHVVESKLTFTVKERR